MKLFITQSHLITSLAKVLTMFYLRPSFIVFQGLVSHQVKQMGVAQLASPSHWEKICSIQQATNIFCLGLDLPTSTSLICPPATFQIVSTRGIPHSEWWKVFHTAVFFHSLHSPQDPFPAFPPVLHLTQQCSLHRSRRIIYLRAHPLGYYPSPVLLQFCATRGPVPSISFWNVHPSS